MVIEIRPDIYATKNGPQIYLVGTEEEIQRAHEIFDKRQIKSQDKFEHVAFFGIIESLMGIGKTVEIYSGSPVAMDLKVK